MFDFYTQYDYILLKNGDTQGQKFPITNVKLTKDCYDEGNVIGTAIAKKLEFTIDTCLDLENKEFEYFTAIGKENLTEYNLGTFITVDTKINRTTEQTTVTALDQMIRFDVPYRTWLFSEENQDAGYTVTMYDLLEECCEACQVVLAKDQMLPNQMFVVEEDVFKDGQSCRDFIQAVAQINGCFAQIIEDALYFRLYGTAEQNVLLDEYTYSSLENSEIPYIVDTIILRNSQIEGENVTRSKPGLVESERHPLVIEDNPFAYTQEKREALIEGIYQQVAGGDENTGWGYNPFSVKGLVDPRMNCGDCLQIHQADGTNQQSYLLRMEYISPAGVSGSMSAPAMTKSTVSHQYESPEEEIKRHTEVLVDKAKQEITSIVQSMNVLNDALQEQKTSIDQNTEEIKAQISTMGGNNLISNSVGFKGIEFWNASDSGSYTIVQDVAADENTVAGSGIQINQGSIEQAFTTIKNESYTVSFLYSKAETSQQDAESSVLLCAEGIEVELLQDKHKEAAFVLQSYTFVATQNQYRIRIQTKNESCTVYDLRVTRGSTGQAWSQAQDEVYGKGVLLDKTGIEVHSLEGKQTTLQMDNDSLYIREGETLKTEISDEKIYGQAIQAPQQIQLGNMRVQPISQSRVMIAEV